MMTYKPLTSVPLNSVNEVKLRVVCQTRTPRQRSVWVFFNESSTAANGVYN